ncbi:hypothetical protein ABVD54_005018 [Vibrio parahaemolyticus]|uniref:hypothetical protein n=1 Tax=Vibrio parahaemolyticus TaxID=670 RepID=UPI00046FC765|nr:hypothetical protein [Vibrio parahaemolyticus]EGQ7815816.1 hypothetical protein [Vibrio parahaemolyticus]EGQ8735146.1 hypothetical protein [Vibrio parahaemolyticus]EGQ8886966.1 hypothetical protein [Vibrio parahaemolyticus]EGQ8917795.1 hypothetical protein [Vibrio parahaemolyticus]EGQ8936215.1 hypothetical protein [Vibrio parahaemolyticus]
MKELWEQYKEAIAILISELPQDFAVIGEFVLKWSPLIMLVIVFSKLIDKLFESASIKFLANGFVKVCKLMLKKAYEEPVHKGLIVEAPKRVQRWFHITCAWFQGLQGSFMLVYALIALYPLITMKIREDRFVEGVISLSALVLATIFLAFVQFGLCQQSIKLAKSLKNN